MLPAAGTQRGRQPHSGAQLPPLVAVVSFCASLTGIWTMTLWARSTGRFMPLNIWGHISRSRACFLGPGHHM